MKISCVLEGGLGDFLAALRFIPAIKLTYPESNLILFSNTDLSENQAKLINTLWSGLFSETHQVTRGSQNFRLQSGEVYNAAYSNIIQEDRDKIELSDLVINLCIDSLEWARQIPDWKNYFYYFPQFTWDFNTIVSDKIKNEGFQDKKFILCHLSARDNGLGEIEGWYRNRLIKELEKKNPNHYIYLYCQESRFNIYDKAVNDRVKVFDCSLPEFAFVSKYSDAFVGIDSAPRYLSLYNSKPSYLLSRFCATPGQVSPAHLVRWIIRENFCLPLHYDCVKTAQIVSNSINSISYQMFGHLIQENIENFIVDRKFI